ncbi:CHAT domain-containing protein [Vararia minispora EC-137]|uniref:CHAT domain-containing protein n=1 Tax=Vararia minispora EC-137 TaxID=1314806 RepID=A0ACB8QIJ4_9AGAM|nr:CHAT domain-containing protein [Vararia minispora EC-137]
MNIPIIQQAFCAYRSAATATTGRPDVRIEAAFSWANLSTLFADRRGAFEGYAVALSMITRIAWLNRSIAQRYTKLKKYPNVAREAVFTAITLGEYEAAVEWLEAGRSVVWGQMRALRASLDAVRTLDSPLADKLQSTAAALDSLSTMADSGSTLRINGGHTDMEGASRLYYRLASDWEALLGKARTLPGLENFLLPKKLQELASVCAGPVVFLHIYGFHCDALIVTRECASRGVIHVPLEGLDADKAVRLSGDRGALPQQRQTPHTFFENLLALLWTSIVKPVLDAMSFKACAENETPPRVWWCPTGPLAFLPLHAAGLYRTEEPGTKVFEYVVSSYTPSLSVLHERMHQPDPIDSPSLLAISQPNTPNQNPIPKTQDEVAQIIELLALSEDPEAAIDVQWLDDADATVSAASTAMGAHSCVHFACHGIQHPSEPIKTTFKLADGDLTLLDIISAPHARADLAVLSACQTATGDTELAEEAVHMASGMLVAGYRSVIATMWSIRDDDGPRIAQIVYGKLLKGGSGGRKLQGADAAEALHHAVAALRSEGADFLSWVPFIHVGV